MTCAEIFQWKRQRSPLPSFSFCFQFGFPVSHVSKEGREFAYVCVSTMT